METESRFSQIHVCEDDEVIQSDCDRLSELPDSLILSILSCLSMDDVVRTTLLSKRWKDLWATIPCLNFFFTGDYSTYRISVALAKWKGVKMQKFSLSFQFAPSPRYSYIDSWLLFAIEKQVEEVSLNLYNSFIFLYTSDYFAPQRLYSCSSIKKLSLAFLNLKIEDKVQWDNLKSLTIIVEEFLSEDIINQVLCGAPQLEELILAFMEISENLNIRSTTLKTLEINQYALVHNRTAALRIWAPNLVTLEILGLDYHDYSLVVPSLTNAILSLHTIDLDFMPFEKFNEVFRSISHVEKLTLSKWFIKFLLDMKYTNYMDVPLSSNAKFLKLYAHRAEEILDVLDIFPKLMHTIVDHKIRCEPSDHCGFGSPSVVELKIVEITWSVCDGSIFQVIEYLLENAHKLEKMVLRLRMPYEASLEMFVFAEEKVQSMPRSSPTAQLIITKI